MKRERLPPPGKRVDERLPAENPTDPKPAGHWRSWCLRAGTFLAGVVVCAGCYEKWIVPAHIEREVGELTAETIQSAKELLDIKRELREIKEQQRKLRATQIADEAARKAKEVEDKHRDGSD